MIEVCDRPPNYATPIKVFTSAVTRTDRFFVSYRATPRPIPITVR